MDRRTLLSTLAGTAGAGTLTGTAGCLKLLLGGGGKSAPSPPPRVGSPPPAVYRPTHAPTPRSLGSAEVGDYRVAAMVGLPVRFWTVSGGRLTEQPPGGGTGLHVMAAAWDPETGTALPGAVDSVELVDATTGASKGRGAYPMIGQRAGFHYGENFGLAESGRYAVRVELASMADLDLRRTGAFAGRFEAAGSNSFGFEFDRAAQYETAYERPDDAGSRGALALAKTPNPPGQVPVSDALPGRVVAETRLDGAQYVATLVSDPPSGLATTSEEAAYLAVSPRTPHHRLALPWMGLRVDVARDGETLASGSPVATLDPDLGYHYGLSVPALRAGDELALQVSVPPQVARHEGYETAFVGPAETSVTLG